jgi:hypothetical protein
MSPVAAAVAVYVLAISVGIALYVTCRDSLESLYERLRWRLAEHRASGRRGYGRTRPYHFSARVEELRRQRLVLYARLMHVRRSYRSAFTALLATLIAQSQLLVARLAGAGRRGRAGVLDVGAKLGREQSRLYKRLVVHYCAVGVTVRRAFARQRATKSAPKAAIRRPLAAALAGVVLAGAALTAVLTTHDFRSNRRDAASTGTSRLQAVPWTSSTWLLPHSAAHPPVAHVRVHPETRTVRATKRTPSQQQRQTAVQQTAFVSNTQTISAPSTSTAVAPAPQGSGPSALPAPKGPSPPTPLKAP